MQDSLTVGTPVMTTAGIHGTVAAIGDGTVDVEIAPGVVVTFARPAILEVRKPPATTDGAGDAHRRRRTPTAGDRPADRTRLSRATPGHPLAARRPLLRRLRS